MADEDEKPANFELKLISIKGQLRAGQVASGPSEVSPFTEKRRNSQERIRQLADEYANEALLKHVYIMRHDPDSRIQQASANVILNRAIGLAKAISEEEKKGADAGSILDVLAAVSAYQGKIERTPPDAPVIEHNPDDENFEKLMQDIKTDGPIDDDAAEGELIDG